jgi:hypothetical protein
LGFKSENKETLSLRLDNLLKAFRNGNFTNETFALIEIQIKRLQAELESESTPTAQALEPKDQTDEQVIKAITQFNNLFKK